MQLFYRIANFWIVLVYFSFISSVQSQYRLNVPRILLPYRSGKESVPFKLHISNVDRDSCFKWRTSRPDSISLSSETECSAEAVVKSLSDDTAKFTAVIFAEDSKTGAVLKHEVIVDRITKIEIKTTTRKLYIDDPPDVFEVVAKNEENDTFSSLDGVIFDWRLSAPRQSAFKPGTDVLSDKTLQFVKFSQSVYETSDVIKTLESRGLQGNKVLIAGIGTGRAKLTVKLRDPEYRNVNQDEIDISVVTSLLLTPSHHLHVLVGAILKFKLETLKQGRLTPVTLHHQDQGQYFLTVSEPSVCQSQQKDAASIACRALGIATISLEDKYDPELINQHPEVQITVVEPALMEFRVHPQTDWVFEVGKFYEVSLAIFDQDGHEIYLSDNIHLASKFPGTHFRLHRQTENGSFSFVEALKPGKTVFQGSFGNLNCRQDVEIYDNVTLHKNLLVFPSSTDESERYTVDLQALGGSGKVTWSSTNSNVATVSQGHVMTSNVLGLTYVRASDVRNYRNQAECKVIVGQVDEIKVQNSVIEFELGSVVDLPLFAYTVQEFSTAHRLPFDDCSLLELELQPENSGFRLALAETKHELDSCATLRLSAERLSERTIVKVVLNRMDLQPLTFDIEASVYPPLRVVHPSNEFLLLMIGSSWTVMLAGGPSVTSAGYVAQGLVTKEAEGRVIVEVATSAFYANLPSNADGISTTNHFLIRCIDAVDTVVTFTVGRVESEKSQSVSSTQLRIICGWPHSISLSSLIENHSPIPKCPKAALNRDISLHFEKPSGLQLLVYDDKQRLFSNLSSPFVDYRLIYDDLDTVEYESVESAIVEIFERQENSVWSKFVVQVRPEGKKGEAKLTVEMNSYAKDRLPENTLKLTTNVFFTSTVHFVDYFTLNETTVDLLNHEDNFVPISISDGSGHFFVDVTNQLSLIGLDLNDRQLTLSVKGHSGQVDILAYDLCVSESPVRHLTASVQDPDLISIDGPNTLQLGKPAHFQVLLLSKNGQILVGRELRRLIEMTIEHDKSVLQTSYSDQNLPTRVDFLVIGKKLGLTSIRVHITFKGVILHSKFHEIQIFEELSLSPKTVNLIIGSAFQLKAEGGPQANGQLNFSVNDSSVARVSSDGLIESLKVGKTKIMAVFQTQSTSGQIQQLCEDSVVINVLTLDHIKIRTPSFQVYINSTLDLHVEGFSKDGQLLSSLSWSAPEQDSPIEFDWLISNAHVTSDRHAYVISFAAHQAGEVEVSVKVVVKKTRLNAKPSTLRHKIVISVLEPVRAVGVQNKLVPEPLLVTPHTVFDLNINRPIDKIDFFSNQNDSVINIESFGKVETLVERGSAFIYGRIGNQKSAAPELFALNVQVQPVNHMKFSIDSNLIENGVNLPIGCKVDFDVTFRDEFGRQFSAVNSKLSFRPNRFDLADLYFDQVNSRLTVRFKKQGEITVQVFDSVNSALVSYLHFIAKEPVWSSVETLNLGKIVCLHSKVPTEHNFLANQWSTSNSAVLRILSDHGVALASSVGVATVSHQPNDRCLNEARIRVDQPASINFNTELAPIILAPNDLSSDTYQDVPVSFAGAKAADPDCLKQIAKLAENDSIKFFDALPQFGCRLSIGSDQSILNRVISVADKTHFSLTLNSHVCRLKVSKLDDPSTLSRLHANLTLKLVSVENQDSVDQVEIQFFGPILVQPRKILLDNLDNVGKLVTVTAFAEVLKNLQIKPNLDGVLHVGKFKFNMTTGHAKVQVKLTHRALSMRRADVENLTVKLYSTTTEQQVDIPIDIQFFEAGYKKTSTFWGFLQSLIDLYGTLLLMFSTILATVCCMYVGYRLMLDYSSRHETNAMSSLQQAKLSQLSSNRLTPVRKGANVSPSQQQMASSPYLWSVPRTQQHSAAYAATPGSPNLSSSFGR